MENKIENKKIDVLAFGAHPDDVEACAGGLLIKLKNEGFRTGIIDVTKGELSNFGTAKERKKEAKEAAGVLKLDIRENLNIADGHIYVDQNTIEKVMDKIRQYKADILIFPYWDDLHPDHAAVGMLGRKAAFLSKIEKYKTSYSSYQPAMVLFYMLHTEFQPSFVIDITEEYEKKMEALKAHQSQFFKKEGKGYSKEFHNKDFLEFWEARARYYGYKIGARYAEPYLVRGLVGLKSINGLMLGDYRSLTTWKIAK